MKWWSLFSTKVHSTTPSFADNAAPGLVRTETVTIQSRAIAGVLTGVAWLAVVTFAAAESPLILGDREFYSKDSFIAYAAPWSTYSGAGTSLKHGRDFVDEIAVQPETFPVHSEFSWHWPLTPAKHTGVYGYNALSFGNYDGGTPQKPVAPRQVKEIGALVETFGFEMARGVGDFNVLTELYLTKKPAGEKLCEIGFFPRPAKSAIEFANAGEPLGTFADAGGRAWKVAVQTAPAGAYYMFIPAAPVLSGAIDFKAALEFLRAKGRVTGEEWFNGLAFGIEPVAGSGSLRVKRLSVDYQ
jgi:hypothetical protein